MPTLIPILMFVTLISMFMMAVGVLVYDVTGKPTQCVAWAVASVLCVIAQIIVIFTY